MSIRVLREALKNLNKCLTIGIYQLIGIYHINVEVKFGILVTVPVYTTRSILRGSHLMKEGIVWNITLKFRNTVELNLN